MLNSLFPNNVKNIFFAWGASIFSVSIIIIFFKLLAPEVLNSLDNKTTLNLGLIVSAVIIAPLWEELLFRYAPIEILRKTIGEDKFNLIQLPVIIFLAIIFGWMHGTVGNIFIQGISGFFLGWVYIANGYSYISAVILHALWNFMLLVGLPILFTV